MNLKIFFFITLSGMLLASCIDHTMSPMNNMSTAYFSIVPNDGTTNVAQDAFISITFVKSVDRSVVERNFYLISERDIADSLCPISNMMGHGNMDIAMMDSVKMHHLDTLHHTRGRFMWNDDSTQCTFSPDSMMMSNMRYMIHMRHEMMQMMESRMGDMGTMGGHGGGMMSDDMMYHFRTIDSH